MKFSKSILIFLVFSSLAGAFFYALDRTNGNLFKSLQFTLYFLAIKMGLIGPNLPLKLDHHQPTQQLVSRVNKVELPGYHPYLSVYNDYRPSGLFMDSIERYSLVPQYSYSQDAINELRAGNSRVREAAWLLITIWMLQQQSVGFQPVRPVARPPHLESARNLLFGKPKPDQFSSQRFETKVEGRKRHRAELNIDMDEQYRQFLLTKNTNTNCSQKRFEELCVEEKNGRVDYGSIDEALSILEAEGQGIVNNAVRPGKSKVDADFEIEGPGPYDVADVKIPINWGKGNEDLKAAAERMGGKIVAQRLRMQDLGKTPLHIVDLRKLSPNEKLDYKQNLINTIGHSKDLVFLREETKI